MKSISNYGYGSPKLAYNWNFDGKVIQCIQPQHCQLLVGYDDNYIFNDPQLGAKTYFSPDSKLDMVEQNLLEHGVTYSVNNGSMTFYNIPTPNDLISNPKFFDKITPQKFYQYLKANGYSPLPLNDGSLKGISFEDGGGYRIYWGGDKLIMYHPDGLNHHGGNAYWKISSGNIGTLRFDLHGNSIT